MTEWINYHGLNRHLFVPPTQGPRPMTDAERIKELEARVAELEAALAKANEPRWFYSDEKGTAWRSMEEAVEEFCDDLEPGRHLVEIETARPCPTIWGVVHFFTKTELEDQHRDGGPFEGKPYNLTVCATEAEARALLKEPRND